MNIHQKFFSKIGTNYLIYAICALIFQIVIFNILGIVNYELLNDFNLQTILSAICNYILPLPILLFLMRKLDSHKIEKSSLNIQTFIKYLCIALTIMWIGNLLGLAVTFLVGNLTQTDISNPVQDLINSTDIWLNLLLISIIGPIFEELFFRKLLVDRTMKYGAKVSIIISATLFGFIHGNLNQFFYAFLLGGFFAYIYIKTGKIIYTIIYHIIINLMGSVVSLSIVDSASAISQGAFTPFDLSVVLIYFVFIVVVLLIGLLSLLRYNKSKIDEIKTEVTLTQPFRTMFLNYGMVLFIIFCIGEMIYTTII